MKANIYESPRLLAEYLLFHFGAGDDLLPAGAPAGMAEALGFAQRTVGWFSPGPVGRALDLGCAVGRSSYELARDSAEVIGVDFSAAFIAAAEAIGAGPLVVARHDEGFLSTPVELRLPDGVDPSRVRFLRGDAHDLPASLGSFDRVHAANLLCRLAEPHRLLARLASLVRPGGELVLATPCTWLEEFTRPENWPSGRTLDWLKDHLNGDFELAASGEEPFLIRETSRKFQWSHSQLSRWRRRMS